MKADPIVRQPSNAKPTETEDAVEFPETPATAAGQTTEALLLFKPPPSHRRLRNFESVSSPE
ncbi:MAG TPA: hypothetical protein VIU34_33275 [Steroidobacter sp.]